MTTTLITGANRGIGLEHVRQPLAVNETGIAAAGLAQSGQFFNLTGENIPW